ncbi:MAG: iron ABC transporter permease [Clostridiales bacterium]|jgi:iron(III) transport system permease protein|nr:iron ABC transporter permease [Clostridiales bacterium]
MERRRRDVWFYIGLAILIIYIFFLLYPICNLLIKSLYDGETGNFTWANFQKFFSKKYYYGSITNSLNITFWVTVFSVLVATPLAYLTNTVKIKFRSAIEVLILITSVSPPFIGAYSWILLLGRNGAITNMFKDNFNIATPDIYGFTGIVLVLTLQLVPLVYIYISGALKNVDVSIVEAAESLGCTGINKVLKIILPVIVPTILAASLLVFMRALADFGTPMLIGEGYRTVPVLIYNEFMGEMGGDTGFAAAISIMIVFFATLIFFVQQYISSKKSFAMSTLNPMKPKPEKGIYNMVAHLVVYVYVVIALAPQLYVIYTSFLKVNGRLFVPGYSLESYAIAFSKVGGAIVNTIVLGLISLVLIIIFSILVAYITVRRRGVLASSLDVTTMFPYIVPGSVMGIALLLTFSDRPFLISGTAFIMILAFTIRRLAYTVRSSSAILSQINISTEDAGISLGASQLKTFFVITLPSMLPGIVSGAILSWINILTELATSILLYVASTRTVTVAIYTEVVRGNYGTAAALSTILTVITIISLAVFFKLSDNRELSI